MQLRQQMVFFNDLHHLHLHCSCPLLMFSSLRWTKASDNELTFSIMILLHFITSFSYTNLQILYKNNRYMLCLVGAATGVCSMNHVAQTTA